MRFGRLMMATLAAATLAGCVGDDQPNVAASAPAPAASAIGPDIQKILAAGGIDANQPNAPRGQVAAAAVPVPAQPALQPPPPSAGVTQVATAERTSNRRRRKGDRKTKDEAKAEAIVQASPPMSLVPSAEAYASAPAAQVPPAPQPVPSVQPPPAAPGWIAAQPGVQSLPDGTTQSLSPNMAPIQTVRLPTVASSPDLIPQNAPRQAVVTSTPVNYNFLNGVGPGAQQQQQQAPQQQAPQPQLFPPQYPPQQALLGAVPGPSPQQVLQPLLDPNTLLAQPRGGRRAGPERNARRQIREAASAPRATSVEPRAVVAQQPAPPPPPAVPTVDSARPAVRRF